MTLVPVYDCRSVPTIISSLTTNKSVSSFLMPVHNTSLLALLLNAVLLRRPAATAVDRYLPSPPGPQQQTRRTGMQRSIDGTDGRTPYRYIDSAACYASSVNNCEFCNFAQLNIKKE